jgi:hypothetical protein
MTTPQRTIVRHPMLIGLVAILLPGVGQVLNQQPQRGLTFLFFLLLGGWVSYHLTTPDHSFLGRYAGGIFVYAMSILDAYKWARVRYEQSSFARGRDGR